ncbi:MAG: hypothetical protein RhofKO_40340 [Rhodothermales bacterium]
MIVMTYGASVGVMSDSTARCAASPYQRVCVHGGMVCKRLRTPPSVCRWALMVLRPPAIDQGERILIWGGVDGPMQRNLAAFAPSLLATTEMSQTSFAPHFADLDDPRRDQGKRHRLDHVLVIALCAVVAGADGWDDIATFACAKARWLQERLDLEHATPSGDTFRRVFAALCPDAFAQCFVRWVEAIAQQTAGEVIVIDGKTLRRSYEKYDPKAALHIISAWACQQRLVLAQENVDSKRKSRPFRRFWLCLTWKGASSRLMRWACKPRSVRTRRAESGGAASFIAQPVAQE